MTMCFIIYVLGIVVAFILTIFPLGKILIDLMRGKCSMVEYCTDNKILLIGGVVGFAVASVFVLQGYSERRNEYLHYVNNGVETMGEIDKVRKVRKPGGSDAYAYVHKVKYTGENVTTFERAYDYAVGDKVRVLYLKDDIHQAMVFDFSNGVLYHALMLMMGLAFASLATSLFLLSCKKFATKRGYPLLCILCTTSFCMATGSDMSGTAKEPHERDEAGLSALAAEGNVDAQAELAWLYHRKMYATKDELKKAFELAQAAAEQGNVTGMAVLGSLYANGYGVEKDVAKGFEWSRKAADKGNAFAVENTGIYYWDVEKDYEKAQEQFRKAAYMGNYEAYAMLGTMYLQGDGVEQDFAKALGLYLIAAERGVYYAYGCIGKMYGQGLGVERDYTQCAHWYRKSAMLGEKISMCNMGFFYLKGVGVEKDTMMAQAWFRKAAEVGDAEAMMALTMMYYEGCGVLQDIREAEKWAEKAAAAGHLKAQQLLMQLRWLQVSGEPLQINWQLEDNKDNT